MLIRNKVAIVEAGSLYPVTHYLKSTNPNLQEYATALLLTLSASSHNKPAITASNPIPLLFEILKTGSKQARTDSLMSLYNLSTLPENLLSLVSLHPIPPLLTLIRSCRRKASKIAEKSCALLESLVTFDQGRIALIEETGGVLTVVEVIEEGSLLAKEHAVGTLLTMCESNRDKYREVILSEGAIPGLLELTVHGMPKSRMKARKLLELLRNSTYDRPRLEVDTIDNIVSDVVLQMDGQDCADKARRMVAEMVRVSMERSLRHLKQRAFYV